jgi:hypothetical protein
MISLANKLKAPFATQNKHLKEFVLQTYAPAAKRIKDVHATFEEKVDPALTESICAVDDAFKEMEAELITEEEDFKTAYMTFKVSKNANTEVTLIPRTLEQCREPIHATETSIRSSRENMGRF